MNSFSIDDKRYMRLALRLAVKAKGTTFPNPAVGAVVVDTSGNVAGSGATQVCGGPHAEKVALEMAGEKAGGGTLYITLEPCCHHGRTPPCTDAILLSGIRRVVVAVKDPNPLVCGKGLELLAFRGIKVETGLMEKEAVSLNEDFFHYITGKRAWVTLKLALTLDGRIGDCDGNSKWITGEQSRKFVHELRRRHSAVAVGRRTLTQDNPQLTVRHRKWYNPARVVFSSSADIPPESYFVKHATESRSVIVVPGGEKGCIAKKNDMEVWFTGETDRRQSLISFCSIAYEQNLPSIFLEGGSSIASEFLEAGLVNRLYLFYGNKLLGKGIDAFRFGIGLPMEKCIHLTNPVFKQFGEDIMITGIPAKE